MANTGGFENNILSASLLGRRGVSVELGANPCLRKSITTITIHERYGLYYADLLRPETRTVAPTFTITGDDMGTPRPYDSEDNESHIDYDPWIDDGDSSDDEESRANVAVPTAIHLRTETQREHDQWDYYNGQPASIENAAYMWQTMRRLQNGTLPSYDRDYLEMREERFLNGSDHRAVILHLDI